MIGAVSRSIFHTLAGSQGLKQLASRYVMRPRSFARRFIAGETVDEAIDAARSIESAGLLQTLDMLGQRVATMAEADAATRQYLTLMERIDGSGIGRNLSLKLTQLGLTVDRATCVDNLRRVLDGAGARGFFIRLDMEASEFTQVTLDIFETMWQQGYRNAGIVLQSCLPRSMADARRMNELGARVRLVKGAYSEPRKIAYRSRASVDAAFIEIMQLLLTEGTYPAIATHDASIIEATRTFAARRGLAADRYEYQFLHGIRRDLHTELNAQGYRVRVYVPFGGEWFRYFMRHLGQRPANVRYFVRSIVREH
jgi:proline dehydrogenase